MAVWGIVAAGGRGARLLRGLRAGWAIEGLLVGGAAAYLVLRQPLLAVGLGVLLAIPAALARPGLLVAVLVPLSVLSSGVGNGLGLLVAGIAVLLVAVACRAAVGTRERARFGRPHLAIVLLGTVLILSVHGAGPSTRASDLGGLLAGLALLAAVAALPARPRTVARLVVLAGGAAAVSGLIAGVEVSGRLAGVGLLANYFGAMLAVPAAAGVGLARVERRILWLVPSALCVAAIVQTHSRGAAIAAGAGLAVALLAGRRLPAQIAGAALVAAAAVVMLHVANPLTEAVVSGRDADQLDINNRVRLDAVRLALTEAAHHPVLGIGYGAFPQVAAEDPHLYLYMNTHDDYVRLAAESGVAALLLFLVLLGAGLFARAGPAFVPLLAGVGTGAANLLFANSLANLTVSGVFWVCLGTLLAGRRKETVNA
ncbi:O-antigen ligase family protein [Dactylosporangium sp. CA-092794]|uniref:O-antigen ligase family protein n=1 Tax=Dactylosporangium sp. CA-092794 TaxID=3239929 RepID=UPI003D8D4529